MVALETEAEGIGHDEWCSECPSREWRTTQ
jgi:hypothetical protein